MVLLSTVTSASSCLIICIHFAAHGIMTMIFSISRNVVAVNEIAHHAVCGSFSGINALVLHFFCIGDSGMALLLWLPRINDYYSKPFVNSGLMTSLTAICFM